MVMVGIERPGGKKRVSRFVKCRLVESDGKQSPWSAYALQPAAGTYFDVEQGGLLLNGRESDG